MTKQYERLNDSQWAAISVFFNLKRKRKHDLREIMDAIRYLLRTGTQWRNLPDNFPKWESVYYYFRKWQKDETFNAINDGLNRLDRIKEGREPHPSLLCVDSQSVKLAPFMNECRGLDANKKVNGRKRQFLVDTGGRLWAVILHEANVHDGIGGKPILEQSQYFGGRLKKVLGDNPYGGEFAEEVKKYGLEYETASKPESHKGFVPIAKRWVVERSFGWTNFFRRLTKDYERTVNSAANWLILGNLDIMLQRVFPKPN